MPPRVSDELEDLKFEIIAIRLLVVQLFADKLSALSSPKKGANLLVERAYSALAKTSLREPVRMRLTEYVVSILDDAARAALDDDRRGKAAR